MHFMLKSDVSICYPERPSSVTFSAGTHYYTEHIFLIELIIFQVKIYEKKPHIFPYILHATRSLMYLQNNSLRVHGREVRQSKGGNLTKSR